MLVYRKSEKWTLNKQVAVQLSKSGNSEAAHILKLKHQQKKAAVAKPVSAKTTTWRFPRLVAHGADS